MPRNGTAPRHRNVDCSYIAHDHAMGAFRVSISARGAQSEKRARKPVTSHVCYNRLKLIDGDSSGGTSPCMSFLRRRVVKILSIASFHLQFQIYRKI